MIFIAIYIILLLFLVKIYFRSTSKIYNGVECLSGKVAVITGGNRGIGLEISKCLASRGCKLILGCRSKAENERRELVELTHNENITVIQLDLRSFESVRNFVKEVKRMEDRIDILINNAGIAIDWDLTPDGLHPVMEANALSPFLLTHLLIDLLKKSDDGRIVFSSSLLAFYNNLTLKNLNPTLLADGSLKHCFQMYGNSKLAQVIISNGLSEKVKMYGIKSNAVHPGMINTSIWNSLEKPKLSFLENAVKLFFYVLVFLYSKTPQEGAQTIVAVAVSNKYKDVTGKFYWGFGMADIYPSPKSLRDKIFCAEIWKSMELLVKLKQNEAL